MKYVGGTWWELKLEEGWQAHQHPECLSITRSEDGAFQLSAVVKTAGVVLPVELEAQSRKGSPEDAVRAEIAAGEFSGFEVGFVEDGTHWQRFWLANGNLLVFATYNGSPQAWETERASVYAMLATLRLRDASNALPA